MIQGYKQIEEAEGRIYVVGDIHGTLEELSVLVDFLLNEENFSKEDSLIFVGDYIDRGYNSKQVIDLILSFRRKFKQTYFLRGNHEDMFLGYLGLGGDYGENFLANGGSQTLISYGIDQDAKPNQILKEMPKKHLDFFTSLHSLIEINNYYIVHAGFNPLRDPSSQTGLDLFWIRDEFIMSPHSFEKTIIFGHTPFKNIFVDLPYKIGIDTGVVYGNILTCVELKERRALQIKAGKEKVLVDKIK